MNVRMCKGVSASALLALIVCMIGADTCRAQDIHRNAWGFYAAPTLYGIAKGTEYQVSGSGGGLDIAVYYARVLSPSFSARIEARADGRNLDDVAWSDSLQTYLYFRLRESILEVPLMLQADHRVDVGGHTLRVSAGAGVSWKFVLDQKLLFPSGETHYLTAADSYQKLGVLVDGGVAFDVDSRTAIFARLRLDMDVSTFGEPADASVIRRLWATGLYVGYEAAF